MAASLAPNLLLAPHDTWSCLTLSKPGTHEKEVLSSAVACVWVPIWNHTRGMLFSHNRDRTWGPAPTLWQAPLLSLPGATAKAVAKPTSHLQDRAWGGVESNGLEQVGRMPGQNALQAGLLYPWDPVRSAALLTQQAGHTAGAQYLPCLPQTHTNWFPSLPHSEHLLYTPPISHGKRNRANKATCQIRLNHSCIY